MFNADFFYSKVAPFLLIVAAGIVLGFQVATNSRLRFGVGSPVLSAAISFVVGLLFLSILISFNLFGGLGKGMEGMKTTPSWAFAGGIFGAFYVLATIFVLPKLGSVITIASAIFGQQVSALLLDTNGCL